MAAILTFSPSLSDRLTNRGRPSMGTGLRFFRCLEGPQATPEQTLAVDRAVSRTSLRDQERPIVSASTVEVTRGTVARVAEANRHWSEGLAWGRRDNSWMYMGL